MDGFALEKQNILKEMKEVSVPAVRLRDRAKRLFDAAGVTAAERKMAGFIVSGLRDAPLIDFPAPVKRIEQRVIPDLTVDYNFANIPRVDRCMTCHTGIDKVRVDPKTQVVTPAFGEKDASGKEIPRVYRTHPRPELFVSSSSPHAMEKVGCTVCHDGLGWGLTFNDAYHMPSTKEQEEDWAKKYHWHKGESWDYPMLPLKHIEASCAKCHRDPVTLGDSDNARVLSRFAKEIPGAPKWNRGLRVVERSGCFGCHKIEGYVVPGLDNGLNELAASDPAAAAEVAVTAIRKTGPSLHRVASKWTSKERAWKWIWSPRSFRPTTNMPHAFGQVNNRGSGGPTQVDYDKRTQAEVWGIVELLWSRSEKWEPAAATVKGDAARGKALFADNEKGLGCAGCHSTKDHPNPAGGPVNTFAPELSSVGSKTGERWLADWIRKPQHYWPGSKMPSLRATDQEAADLAAYLASLRDTAWEADAPAPPDASLVRALAVEAYRSKVQPGEDPTKLVDALPPADQLLAVGQAAIQKYGCFGCHDIKGWESAERLGVELGGGGAEGWGSKDVDRLDFGVMEDPHAVATFAAEGAVLLPHRRPEWAKQKLLNPRIFDVGLTKQPHEKLVMPNFGLSDDDADAAVTFLLSLQKGEVPPAKRVRRTPQQTAAEKMKWIARQYNCAGCHTLEAGRTREWDAKLEKRVAKPYPIGGDIRPWVGENRDLWPPTLGGEGRIGEGARVQPQWLYGFLRDPGAEVLRFWIPTRMPTFPFSEHELNALVHGFAAADGVSFPFEDQKATLPKGNQADPDAAELFKTLDCAKCHPTKGQTGPMPSGLAPDLAFAYKRLRYDWVRQWLDNPPTIIPGANMPAYWRPEDKVEPPSGLPKEYFGNDPHLQMRRIADHVFWLGAPKDGGGGK